MRYRSGYRKNQERTKKESTPESPQTTPPKSSLPMNTKNRIATLPYPTLPSPRKHLPSNDQNPHLKNHAHNPKPKNHIPVLARRALQQPHERIHIQARDSRGRVPVRLAGFDHGAEELRRRPDHARQVEDEEDEGLEDDEAREQAALEGEQDDDPDEDFGRGADCYAVGDDPARQELGFLLVFLICFELGGPRFFAFIVLVAPNSRSWGFIFLGDGWHETSDLPRSPQAKRALLVCHFGKVCDQVQAGYDHENRPADQSCFWPAVGVADYDPLERGRDFGAGHCCWCSVVTLWDGIWRDVGFFLSFRLDAVV